MHVHFNGHTTAPSPEKVSVSELQSFMPDEERGFFDYEWEAGMHDDVITVSFTTRIWINKELSNSEASEVLAHERKHFEDFRRLAREMKEDMEEALEAGEDPEISARLEWFDYDNCVARQQMHASVGVHDMGPCIQPFTPRPH